MTCQLRRLADRGLLSGGLHVRESAALNGVMHPPESGPQAVFRLGSSPRATRLEIAPLPGDRGIGQLATILLPN